MSEDTRQKKKRDEQHLKLIQEILALPDNQNCADCGARAPRWTSVNIGCFLCIRCAGLHRKLGTHITKIKSTTLDTWSAEQIEFVRSMGNRKVNEYYLSRRNAPVFNINDDREMETYLRQKYEKKSYCVDGPDPQQQLAQQKKQAQPQSFEVPLPSTRTKTVQFLGANTNNALGSTQQNQRQSIDANDQLVQQLRQMGFENNEHNQSALMITDRNIDQAISLLLEWGSNSRKASNSSAKDIPAANSSNSTVKSINNSQAQTQLNTNQAAPNTLKNVDLLGDLFGNTTESTMATSQWMPNQNLGGQNNPFGFSYQLDQGQNESNRYQYNLQAQQHQAQLLQTQQAQIQAQIQAQQNQQNQIQYQQAQQNQQNQIQYQQAQQNQQAQIQYQQAQQAQQSQQNQIQYQQAQQNQQAQIQYQQAQQAQQNQQNQIQAQQNQQAQQAQQNQQNQIQAQLQQPQKSQSQQSQMQSNQTQLLFSQIQFNPETQFQQQNMQSAFQPLQPQSIQAPQQQSKSVAKSSIMSLYGQSQPIQQQFQEFEFSNQQPTGTYGNYGQQTTQPQPQSILGTVRVNPYIQSQQQSQQMHYQQQSQAGLSYANPFNTANIPRSGAANQTQDSMMGDLFKPQSQQPAHIMQNAKPDLFADLAFIRK
ncbi:Protein gts1 [Batrachochytrium dendrobatidis]|nr:Protein gts1 [Batrachochytrium dendrobatidis]